MKLDKALVPLDGSRLAEAAIPMAVDLLKDHPTATLVLVRAAEASRLPGVDPTKEQIRVVREAETYLASVAAGLVGSGVKNVRTSVWYGPAAPAIVEAAQFGGVDLIVMSTHGRTGIGRLILGSVAESVLRSTRTPILLVRNDGAPLAMLSGETPAWSMKETAHV
ncbi:MAG TPA: universal stress protein [Methylomirabilota bacterium]|jgi:nucleotide-binding universal stress UspA family protein|nr:universal stress protein [Methylomirabilota bacterium]